MKKFNLKRFLLYGDIDFSFNSLLKHMFFRKHYYCSRKVMNNKKNVRYFCYYCNHIKITPWDRKGD